MVFGSYKTIQWKTELNAFFPNQMEKWQNGG